MLIKSAVSCRCFFTGRPSSTECFRGERRPPSDVGRPASTPKDSFQSAFFNDKVFFSIIPRPCAHYLDHPVGAQLFPSPSVCPSRKGHVRVHLILCVCDLRRNNVLLSARNSSRWSGRKKESCERIDGRTCWEMSPWSIPIEKGWRFQWRLVKFKITKSLGVSFSFE